MLIVCPRCATSYEVMTETIGDTGRTVRCGRCREEWFAAAPPIQLADVTAAAAALLSPTGTVVDHPAPPALPHQQLEWDVPMPEPGQTAPVAVDGDLADEDAAPLWGVPQTSSPPLAPDAGSIDAAPSPSRENSETSTPRPSRRPRQRRLGRTELPMAPTLIAVQAAVISAGLLWHDEIIRLMPQTASFFRVLGLNVNTRGLAFADVRTSTDVHDGVTVLVVEGTIVNTTASAVIVPRLRFALRNAAFMELFSWTAIPDKGALGHGETLPFRSRLVSPPAGGADILVRFLTRMDFANGAR